MRTIQAREAHVLLMAHLYSYHFHGRARMSDDIL
jgi:hypothetical protein